MARWIKGEVRHLISEAVTPVVSADGFRFKKSSEAFVRRIDGGRQELGLPLVDHNPIFEFSFTLCVRLEAVQEIINRLPRQAGPRGMAVRPRWPFVPDGRSSQLTNRFGGWSIPTCTRT
jgi:hypothetical protein